MTDLPLKPRPTKNGGNTDWDSIPELHDPALTDASIAKMYGIGRTSVTMARLARGLRKRAKYGDKVYEIT